ncbi:hypothetical protein P7C73_g3664, partial [Tremellales sp. Uapishka_1]
MPAIPQDPAAVTAPPAETPKPTIPNTAEVSTSTVPPVTPQPSPAVRASRSHVEVHILRRRFLGPMPEKVINSEEVVEKERRFRKLRRHALKHVMSSGDAEGEEHRRRRRDFIRKIRRHGRDDDSDFGDDDDRWSKRKGKKTGKDVWVGESFDIGQEFFMEDSNGGSSREDNGELDGEGNGDPHGCQAADLSYEESSTPKRPANESRATQETFVTARTRLSGPSTSTLSGHQPQGYTVDDGAPRDPEDESVASLSRKTRNSESSSTQHLVPADTASGDAPESSKAVKSLRRTSSGIGKKLKSAIRKQHPASVAVSEPLTNGNHVERSRSKTVQFPMDPVQDTETEGEARPRKGNKQPVNPEDVLAREGDDAAGTSAGAVEDMMEDEQEEDDEGDILPGDVIMRGRLVWRYLWLTADRMLVRVGHHREEDIHLFDEAAMRRSPCTKMEIFEEYIVVLRKDRLELYQDWTTPFKERILGYKRLCFIIPLMPARTSLSVFNLTDLSLCLATSASRLKEDVQRILRSSTTRTGVSKSRIQNSKQYKWLTSGREGSHMFIFQIAERSRALDWYWELWRELGGELPQRFDVSVPGLSTTIRLVIPEEDEIGGAAVAKRMNKKNTIKVCWEMMGQAVDLDDLLRQRSEDNEFQMELCWKSPDGTIDWISYSTTVAEKSRDWAVLVGLAGIQRERQTRTLQMRHVKHQPRILRLEDGTTLVEPPAIEGYLSRLKSKSASASELYVFTYDAGSTPLDLFEDVHKVFLSSEQARISHMVGRSRGCIDLRDLDTLEVDGANFSINMRSGRLVNLETHSEDIAREWSEGLGQLMKYWSRRHRVEARQKMDAVRLNDQESDEVLSQIWDWCVVEGCRAVTGTGRVFLRKGAWDKFRATLLVLTGGYLVTYKLKKNSFHPRKQRYLLFGAYVYSGLLAQEEVHEAVDEDGFFTRPRVYQDGLQTGDGAEDTTFCVRLSSKAGWKGSHVKPWEEEDIVDGFVPPALSKKPPVLLIFRTRSKLERDRWVWAINAEMERQVRRHIGQEDKSRQLGNVPKR